MISYLLTYIKDVITSPVAVIGLIASLIVLVSMCFNTSKKSGQLLMRIFNLLGSVACVIYALMLGANGVGAFILNSILIVVNFIYMIKLIKNSRSNNN